MTCPTCHKPTPADSVHTCSPVPLLTALDITTIPIDEQHELRKIDDLWQLFTVRENSWVRSLNGYESEFVTCAIRSAALQTAARVACHDTQAGVFVPYMSEDDAMALCAQNAGSADDYTVNLDAGYLAALRDLKVIR